MPTNVFSTIINGTAPNSSRGDTKIGGDENPFSGIISGSSPSPSPVKTPELVNTPLPVPKMNLLPKQQKSVLDNPQGIVEGANEILKGVVTPVIREGAALVKGQVNVFKDIITGAYEKAKQGDISGAFHELSPIPNKEQAKSRFLTLTGSEVNPQSDFTQRVTGKEEPFSLQTEGKDLASSFGFDVQNPFALGGIGLLSAALDYTPFGGEKNAAKALQKAKSAAEAANHLKTMGVSEHIIPTLADTIVGMRKEEDKAKFISDLVSHKPSTFEGINPKQETKITPEAAGPLSDKVAEDYWNKKISEDKDITGITIGGDDLKDFYGKDYNDNNHPIYSQASGKLYTRALKESPEDTVIFTGGGPASGKTELISKALRDHGFKGIIYDSNLSNYEGTVKQIEQARAAGKKVEISGVLPDVDKARTFSLQREAKTGRGISDTTFARGHAGFPAVVKRLIEEGKIAPEDVHILDTRNTSSFEDALRKANAQDYIKDPLDAVKNVEHNENNLKQLYGKENYDNKTGARTTELRVREGSSEAPSANRTDQGDANRGANESVLGQTGSGEEASRAKLDELIAKRDEVVKRLKKNANDPEAIKELDALTKELNGTVNAHQAAVERRARAGDLGLVKNEKGEYVKKPKVATERQRKVVDDAEKQAKMTYDREQAKISLDNALSSNIVQTPMERLGYFGKMRQLLGPAKYLDKDAQRVFREWDGSLKKAKVLANKELEHPINVPTQETWKVIDEYEAGKPTKFSEEIKQRFDDLHAEAKARGLETKYTANYIPHVYKQSGAEISKMMHRYLVDQGMTEEAATEYMNGKKLSADNVRRLGLNPFFVKDRTFPTYAAAREYGLTPKYDNINQLIAHYREYMERNIANREFLDELVHSGRLRLAEYAPSNWKAVELSFSPRGYYAEPRLAETLNALFRNEDALTLGEQTAKFVADLSRRAQEITLSGGFPNSNFNFFSIGQAIKQMTAGDFGVIKPFVRANFNGPSLKFFRENQHVMEQMSKQGIDLGNTIASYDQVYKNLTEAWKPGNLMRGGFKGFYSLAGETFDKMFNEKTFGSFMPQMYISYFKNTVQKGIEKGLSAAEAEKLAGDTTKKMFGVIDNVGRSAKTKDVMSAVFFAPQFREGILHTLFNTGYAGYDLAKSFLPGKKLSPEFAGNRKLLGGMILSYGIYNALNKELNGNYMWDNPDNRKFALRIPYNDGKETMYVEFMPSFLAFARNLAQGAISLTQGDITNTFSKAGTLLSMPVKSAIELATNSDYFGRQIYEENDTGPQKVKAMAKYLGLSYSHPYISELYKSVIDQKQPLWQALTKMVELPVKYGTKANEDKGEYYKSLDEIEKRRAQEKQKFKDTVYAEIQAAKEAGDTQKAQEMVDNLSDTQYQAYKEIRTSEKRYDTIKREQAMYSVYKEVQVLLKKGKEDEARAIVSGLSDEDYKAYSNVKKKFTK